MFDGESSIFSGNTVVNGGGVVYVSDNSVVSFNAVKTSFINNTAGDDGSALAVRTGSLISWDWEAVFPENKCARFGGAVDIFGTASAAWGGVASFSNNTAGNAAGALMILDLLRRMHGTTRFIQNSAAVIGGTVLVATDSRLSCSREMTFAGNSDLYRLGAHK